MAAALGCTSGGATEDNQKLAVSSLAGRERRSRPLRHKNGREHWTINRSITSLMCPRLSPL